MVIQIFSALFERIGAVAVIQSQIMNPHARLLSNFGLLKFEP